MAKRRRANATRGRLVDKADPLLPGPRCVAACRAAVWQVWFSDVTNHSASAPCPRRSGEVSPSGWRAAAAGGVAGSSRRRHAIDYRGAPRGGRSGGTSRDAVAAEASCFDSAQEGNMKVPLLLKRAVIERAGARCEYCGLSQLGQEAQFHVDHIHPVVENGPTSLANLALACVSCSLRKGARRTALDPASGERHLLFNPRRDVWSEHFQWKGCRVVGRSAKGRATVDCLKMNRLLAQAIRREEYLRGRHPPPTSL